MNNPLEITAQLLEKVAEFIDGIEAERLAKAASEQNARAERVKEALQTTIKEADDKVVEKISSDPELTDLINKLAKEASAHVDELGEATSEKTAGLLTADELADQAERRFVEWCLSD